MQIIGLTYDLKDDYKFKSSDPQDASAEFDHPQTVDAVAQAIETCGFKVKRIGNLNNLLKNLDNLGVDIVFNIAEGLKGRNRESQIPVILEAKNIPFVGSDGLTSSLTLDKLMAKKLLVYEGIPTPRFFEARQMSDINSDHLKFPLIVKPRYEGSSKGLDDKARVENEQELKIQIERVLKLYEQPALIEEFISGYEFTVAIVGNSPPEVFAPIQTKIDGKLKPGELFYTYERISSDSIEYIFPPQIDLALQKEIMDLALRVYKAVECLDFGRVDFRVDEQGRPFVLEINPLPSLSLEDVFMIIAQRIGISFSQMIGKIIESAMKRYHQEVTIGQ